MSTKPIHAARRIITSIWFVVLVAVGIYTYSGGSLLSDVKNFVVLWPEYSFFVFLCLYAIRPLVLMPDSIMLFIGGATFGPWIGLLGGYLGENISALVAFSVSRFLGQKWMHRSHIEFVRKLEAAVTKRGFVTLMFLRLIPIAPFDPINYGAGLTSMSYRTFFAGTALGVIPALVVYVFLGSALTDPRLLIPGLLILLFIMIKLFAIRRLAPDIYELGTHHHRNVRK